ncbi:D-erythrulose kinase [Longimycelium tulufanense]|uniref:D-erythrulose kinase n=1 Tax=Longimycelium tulufanense TaxID=907463 RepID=A0A8J3C5P3_9PSEU|nr:dihydroxyacetone kinase family protein [Longimycelium tulufanense]GGM33559.1 D-erythrulose kinase [Longimycelium tulufanense]
MTRLYNDPTTFKDDMVDGFVAAYGRYVQRVPGASGVVRTSRPRPGKVSVIVGGGSGHYPAFCGLVGPGLADGAVIGDIFTSPSSEQAYLVGKALDNGAGVLFSYGNYNGDVMNFGLAERRLRSEGTDCRTVVVTDDIASAPAGEVGRRRGVAGDFCVFKIAGAAAEQGLPIDEVERLARRANAMTRSLGVAFAGCTFPGRDEPLFTIDPGEIELGLGIHGEPGVRTITRISAAELAQLLVDAILEERPEQADGRAAVILNGLGATKYEELFVLWKDVLPWLTSAGVRVVSPEVGELVTSLDMAGCSLTLCWLDDELAELWEAPADTPAFRRGAVAPSGSTAVSPNNLVETVSGQATAPADEPTASEESRRAALIVRGCLESMLATISDNERLLGDIDSVAGDGDHGRGMVRGLRAAYEAAQDPSLGAGSTLRAAGASWADNGGGSSGALWGALLQTVGYVLGDETAPSAHVVASALREGAATVCELGGAQVGDKTLLDSLIPFVEMLNLCVAADASLAYAWRCAADAATDAADRTRDLVCRIGRARPLGEKSVGTPDPGAVSLALCARATAEVLEAHCGGGEQS